VSGSNTRTKPQTVMLNLFQHPLRNRLGQRRFGSGPWNKFRVTDA